MVAEELELPPGFQLLNQFEHLGEMGKIDGRPIDLTVVRPRVPASAARQLCDELAGGAPVEHAPHEVPADWNSCAFESTEQRVLVGTYARFRAYNQVLADDACGPRSCDDDDLVIWIE